MCVCVCSVNVILCVEAYYIQKISCECVLPVGLRYYELLLSRQAFNG